MTAFFYIPLLKNYRKFFWKIFLNNPIEKKETPPFLENAKFFGKFYSQNCVACFKGLKSPIGGGVT